MEVLARLSRFRSSLTKENEAWVHSIVRGDPYHPKNEGELYSPVTPAYQLGTQLFESQGILRVIEEPWMVVGPGFLMWDPDGLSECELRDIRPISEVQVGQVTQALMKARRQVRLSSLSRVARLTGYSKSYTSASYLAYQDELPLRRRSGH